MGIIRHSEGLTPDGGLFLMEHRKRMQLADDMLLTYGSNPVTTLVSMLTFAAYIRADKLSV